MAGASRSFPNIPGLQLEGVTRPRQASHLSGGSSGSDGTANLDSTPTNSRRARGLTWGGEHPRPTTGTLSALGGTPVTENPLRGARSSSLDDSVNYMPSPHHDL